MQQRQVARERAWTTPERPVSSPGRSGKMLRGRAWEVACSLMLLPAVACAVWNADLMRMALGAFGAAPGPILQRWLILGVLLTATALWHRWSRQQMRRSRWLVSLVVSAIIAFCTTVVRARDVQTRNVAFQGNGIVLAGTLFTPTGKGPFPGIVVVHGSAPLKRGFYSVWAERIARAGFIVLVTDKRGVGGTGGTFNNQDNGSRANLSLLAGDVVAAVEYLATQPDVDPARLGLVGVSQAGWVAPLAASRSTRIRYLALVTAPAVSVFEEHVWSELRGDDERSANTTRAAAEGVMDTVGSHGFNPRPVLGALNIPGLWLFGDEDNSIPTGKSVAVLDSLRTSAGKDFSTVRFPRAGHALFTRSTGVIPHIEPASWGHLTAWLQKHGARTEGRRR